MKSENSPLVLDEPVEFDKTTGPRFKTSENMPTILEECIEYGLIQ